MALVATLAFVPGWEGGALTPRWAALALLGAALLFFVRVRPTAAHLWGSGLVLWAALTLLWTPSLAFGLGDLAKIAILAVVFCLAAEASPDEADRAGLAYAAGVALSGYLALAQVAGFDGVPQLSPPAGLFVNKNYLAEAGVLGAVFALFAPRRLWLPLLAGCLLAAVLPFSRGSLLALLAIAVVWLFSRNRLAGSLVTGLGLGAVAALTLIYPHLLASAAERLGVWAASFQHLRAEGWGLGGYLPAYPFWTPHPSILAMRPDHAHNEAVHVLSELGLPGLLLVGGFLLALLGGRGAREKLVLGAGFVVAGFAFPFHTPGAGFALALVAGRLAASRRGLCPVAAARGGAPRAGLAPA